MSFITLVIKHSLTSDRFSLIGNYNSSMCNKKKLAHKIFITSMFSFFFRSIKERGKMWVVREKFFNFISVWKKMCKKLQNERFFHILVLKVRLVIFLDEMSIGEKLRLRVHFNNFSFCHRTYTHDDFMPTKKEVEIFWNLNFSGRLNS